MRNLLLPFIFMLTLLFSCRSESDEVLEKNVMSVDVYVAGRENNEACYWKNNMKTVLTGGTDFKAIKLFVNNTDIYVLGLTSSISTGRDYYFWKNNVKYNIAQYLGIQANTATTENFAMSDFFIDNGNIYIAGLMKNPAPTSTQNQYQYCYWKNGVKTVVFEQHDYQTSASMHLIGNDVYVPLQNNITVSPTATAPTTWDLGYYKNGVYNFISTLSGYSDVHEDGGVLKMLVLDGNNQTVYYKNLSTGVVTPAPSFITVDNFQYYYHQTDNNDKYIIGTTHYYKNNIQHNLFSLGSNFKYLRAFKVLDNNVYKILNTDDNTGVNFNVYINDVVVQSTANVYNTTINNYTEFSSLSVVPN